MELSETLVRKFLGSIKTKSRNIPVVSLSSRSKSLALAVRNYTKAYSKFSGPIQFTLFLYVIQNILLKIVDTYSTKETKNIILIPC